MARKRNEGKSSKHVARQVAALPYRVVDGGVEVLVITSRETRRPVLPKGWPMKGLKDRKAAAVEAREEAGVVGKVAAKPIGSYLYWKRGDADFRLVEVDVYPLAFGRQLEDWKERGQREAAWLPVAVAASVVDEPGLASLVAGFRPKTGGTRPAPGR